MHLTVLLVAPTIRFRPLSAEEIESLRGSGETVDFEEVQRIYLPRFRLDL